MPLEGRSAGRSDVKPPAGGNVIGQAFLAVECLVFVVSDKTVRTRVSIVKEVHKV